MSAQHYLAFDFGAESGRAILGTLDGGTLTLQEKHRFANPTGKINGQLQWNLLQQWEEIKTGLRATAGTTLSGIGVDTWGVDFGLLDEDGNVLGNPVMYRDARTDGVLEAACDKVSAKAIYDATGIQLMGINTLYQLIALKRQNPEILKIARKLLLMPDLFHYLLTGVAKNEFSNATTTQMYDPANNRWADELLQTLDVPAELLGEVVPSGTVLGDLKADVAAECGIRVAPVIAPGTHDTASAVVSVPAEGSDWCYISSGTWSLMGVELAKPVINEKSRAYNYTNEGGVGGTIRFLKNIMGLWLVQECRRDFLRQGQEYSYAELTKLAAAAQPYAAFIDADDAPFGKPGQMPQKVADYCRRTGQTPPADVGATVRLCLEGLALKYRQTLDGLEDILGRRIGVIHIVGGGTQNGLLNQLTADVCGRSVVTGPIEATAIGNVLTQAIATKAIKDVAAARAVVRQSFPLKTYQPTDAAAGEAVYQRYLQAIKR